MARRSLPAVLGFAALLADLTGAHGFALALLLAAIPAAFVLTLDCYGDALRARCGLARPLAAGAGLVLLVLSAALRSPAVVGGVPRVAVSAVVLSLLLYAALAAAALVVGARRPRPARVRAVRTAGADGERLAA
jgi:hypothetical protein